MTDHPNKPNNIDEANNTDAGTEEIVMDDIEAEAGFLEDRDHRDYPSMLQITTSSEQSHRQDALEQLDDWKNGQEIPHIINFQNPSDLRALLTDRRVELLRSIMTERPDSIRNLAERVERNVKNVHDDLRVLADYDIVHFEEAGRAKRPFVPYDTIEISLEISTPRPADDAAPV